jgi:PKHD-type hydroxylase
VLSPADAAAFHDALTRAEWRDGRATAGYQSARTKDNLQLPEDHPLARDLSDRVVAALERTAVVSGESGIFGIFGKIGLDFS